MKNGKYQTRDSTRGREVTNASNTDRSDSGNVVRTIDREQQTNTGQNNDIREQSFGSNEFDTATESRTTNITIPDGFYFTPTGDIARIPDGHYIHNGRLRKRRQRRPDASDASDGNEDRDRTETGNESEFSTESYIREKPINVRGSRQRKQKKLTEHQQRLTMVSMLAVACSATFTSIALITKHRHWSLESEEVRPLAEALNDAFATLPVKAYEAILAIIEKWVPWVNLVFVASAIIIPRIEESVKQYEASRYTTNNGSNKRDARTKDNTRSYETSFGFNE